VQADDMDVMLLPHPDLKQFGAWSSSVVNWFSVMSWPPGQESAAADPVTAMASAASWIKERMFEWPSR
jgi:hypothetical protein